MNIFKIPEREKKIEHKPHKSEALNLLWCQLMKPLMDWIPLNDFEVRFDDWSGGYEHKQS